MSDGASMEESAADRVTRLLAGARNGNMMARDQLVDSVYVRLNRLCQGLKSKFPGVMAYEQTGDVMGEVWPKLLRELSAKEFKNSSHFFSFSATLIRNTLIDLLRKYYGKNGRGAREIALGPKDQHQTDDGLRTAWLEGKDTKAPDRAAMRDEIHGVIARLPPIHQEMFDLRFYHDLKETECADALNVDVRTVRRRWRRARLALAAALGEP